MFTWKKSTRCGSGQCVEVAADTAVRVRETGRADVIAFEPEVWRAFIELVKTGIADG
jgi:hypothetical protein